MDFRISFLFVWDFNTDFIGFQDFMYFSYNSCIGYLSYNQMCVHKWRHPQGACRSLCCKLFGRTHAALCKSVIGEDNANYSRPAANPNIEWQTRTPRTTWEPAPNMQHPNQHQTQKKRRPVSEKLKPPALADVHQNLRPRPPGSMLRSRWLRKVNFKNKPSTLTVGARGCNVASVTRK